MRRTVPIVLIVAFVAAAAACVPLTPPGATTTTSASTTSTSTSTTTTSTSTTSTTTSTTTTSTSTTTTPPPPVVLSGIVTTLAGSESGFQDGVGADARFGSVADVAAAPDGSVYVVDSANFRIRRVSPAGEVTTVAGTGVRGTTDGPAAMASFYSPQAIAVGPDGTVYVAEAVSELTAGVYDLAVINRIRAISPDGVVSTLAGGLSGYADGTGSAARFYLPYGLDVGPDGNLYVAEYGNHRIRKVTPSGEVTTVTSSTGPFFDQVSDLVVGEDGAITYVDAFYRVRRLAGGTVSTVAGSTSSGYVDGAGTAARFRVIQGIDIGADGSLYVGDSGNDRIRRIDPSGVVSTLAGSTRGYADGTGADARFSGISGLTISPSGVAYIGDRNNWRVRAMS